VQLGTAGERRRDAGARASRSGLIGRTAREAAIVVIAPTASRATCASAPRSGGSKSPLAGFARRAWRASAPSTGPWSACVSGPPIRANGGAITRGRETIARATIPAASSVLMPGM
jgi:hypothetical protein